ncbi:hypothetical protein [Cerasicoccus arenae]|uniref:hypothetical protein n=1 Tax=Cerasicoccus arenae TaxID=424488 RepID=UPI0016760055|nr:hypothetical protein [Cerasicoccus arenae]MBK1859659.1 hypothetical protein [Cerasicoccus arenae]
MSLNLDAATSLRWSIRRLRDLPLGDWHRGFPYFGEASELLETWGLYSRSAVMAVLRAETGLALGDELRHSVCLREGRLPRLYLADLSCRRLHRLIPDLH